jgi:hypothetical protein
VHAATLARLAKKRKAVVEADKEGWNKIDYRCKTALSNLRMALTNDGKAMNTLRQTAEQKIKAIESRAESG